MYKKIMVAIDDSATSQSALAEALHIARTSNAKIYIAHVADETLLNLHGQPLVSIVNMEAAVASLSAAGNELLAEAMKLPEVAALVEAIAECQSALTDFLNMYPQMVKGFMVDAENSAKAALAPFTAAKETP